MTELNRLVISQEATLYEALGAINEGSKQIALVVEECRLIGVITDGDLRRSLLAGLPLNSPVKAVMNTAFVSITNEIKSHEAIRLMRENRLHQIPVVDHQNNLVDLLTIDAISQKACLQNSVVIMAGGMGTRLHPRTIDCPKPMLPVNGKPILEILLEQCISFGFGNFYISVNYLKNQIIDYFGDGSSYGVNISYLEEDQPLGTAGSLSLLPHNLDSPFVVINGDVLTRFNLGLLVDYHIDHNSFATLCVREHEVQIPYGVVESDANNRFTGLAEKPIIKNYINAGIYLLNQKVPSMITPMTFLDMPQLISDLSAKSHKVMICPVTDYWLDIGLPETLKQAVKDW